MQKKSQRNHAEVLRDEMYMSDRVLAVLRDGPRTIPEIAQQLDCPSAEVVKWVMALRRYGRVSDLPKGRADDYYQYRLAEAK